MNRLNGKVAIVTGAALGIGRAGVIRMAEEGASIAVLDLLANEGESLAMELRDRGSPARFWRCDVANEAEVSRVFGEVATHFGRVDVVVNNAGVAGANKPTHELTEAEWDWVQAINVKGVFFCTKHSIPLLRRAGGGSIINLSSIYGLVSAPDIPAYHASKGAVRLMTKTDALLYATDKIRVKAIRITHDNAERLWSERKQLFFKPVAGHGGKAVYRGDKLTKSVWSEILGSEYIAQDIAPPSERLVKIGDTAVARKIDVRLYTYQGRLLLAAARLYQGQTTNFRTEGGGFAPVNFL